MSNELYQVLLSSEDLWFLAKGKRYLCAGDTVCVLWHLLVNLVTDMFILVEAYTWHIDYQNCSEIGGGKRSEVWNLCDQ